MLLTVPPTMGVMMQRFEYRTRPGSAIGAIVLGLVFVAGAGFALASGWGIRLYGTGMSADVARWFYLGGIALGVILLVMSVVALSNGRREIVVGPDRIVLPRGEMLRGTVELAPHDVRNLSVREAQGFVTLRVQHARGTIKLPSANFESRAAFHACVAAIDAVLPQR